MSEQPIEVWAFWGHDRYPFCLGGKVVKTFDNGSVFVDGWGNSTFHPTLLVAGKAGEDLHAELYRLRVQYEDKEQGLRRKFKHSAQQVFRNYHQSYMGFPNLARGDVEDE